ncbi:head maturation protease, ClpP-related [Microbacterium plantarum]|uniref:head maturation protease, ClpP-related n=1 Tax=Microbacterium plantarum TaxID=1816425 RepID=UPI002B48E7E5|nr:head maturation protease, ClpP-related [Microbacterium plantarum]WRK16124.1 head maturation protease, ClpP-related [Microbacterium plantarum]
MTKEAKQTNRFWGQKPVPTTKAEFFNAVTTPAPSGDGTVATIRMYGPIDSWGAFWGISTKDIGQVLDAMPDSVDQIILRINSPGGEVFEGVSILNMLRAHKAKVTAVVDGLAASAASVIAAGCDDTVMSPGTQMMIHSPWTFTLGSAAELRKDAERLDGIESSIIEIYEDKAGVKNWTQLLADETWMNATEAVNLGLADRVAVIPDAGETETVGESEQVIVIPDDDETDDSAAARVVRITARAAAAPSMPPVSTEPGSTIRKENVVGYDDLKAGFAQRLGVTDADLTDESLLAALDEALEEQTDTNPTPALAVASVETLPDGAIVVDKAAYEELQSNSAAGRRAMDAIDGARRDGVIASALREGRIAASAKDDWRAQLDKDEDGITKLLASFPKNAVPVTEIGKADSLTSADDALYASAWGSDEKQEA